MSTTFNIDIDTYKSKFTGGSRQYLFYALFNLPSITGVYTIPYLVKSTSIPDRSFEELPTTYSGLALKIAGGLTYGDWQISFNVDEEGVLLKAFHGWMDTVYTSEKSYMKNQQLFLLDGNGTATQKLTLYGAWPKSIGSMGLDYASTDISTVDVTLSFQYFTFENLNSSIADSALSYLLSWEG